MIVCKYKFDKSIYENFIPAFDDGYEGYTVSDEVDNENSNYVIRTIECDSLPTRIRFGSSNGANFKPQRDSLLELIYLNTTNIVNMTDMFAQCINLISINTEGWDTSNVITMYTMFYGCKNLTSLDLSNFITSNVTSMSHMFYNCTNLTSITFGSNFNTSNVTDMTSMFNGCTNLISLDLSNFNTGKVTSMYGMFTNCKNLTSLDVSNWNTSKVTNMGNMFSDCTNLTSLDLSNFDTSKATSIQQMFYNCYSLTSLDVSNFNTSEVTDMNSMFRGCKLLTSLNVSNWDTSNVINMGAMFMECFCVLNLNLNNFDTSKVTNMRSMFQNCQSLTSLDISNWDTSNVTDMAGMFGSCKCLPMLNLLSIDATLAKTDNALHYLVDMDALHTLILGEKSLCDSITTWNGMINVESFPVLEKLICPNADYINKLAEYLPDRSSELNSGVIVTNATISDEAMNTISGKNWSIRKMVAQYRYDANTYEDLIPEFNTEFSSDKYEITDFVSDIVIDDMEWEVGSINADSGANYDNITNRVRCVGYYSILPNTTYKCVNYGANIFWYDESKKFISHIFKDTNSLEVSPANAKYMRVYTDRVVDNFGISAKLITRSIESVNGDLPTQMYFGDLNVTTSYYTGGFWSSLLRVYEITTSSLTTMRGLFRWCDRLTNIDRMGTWDTSNVVDMGYLFDCCYSITSLDVSNWNTSNVTTMNHMFNTNSQALTSLDVSNFNTDNVTAMYSMFANCPGLTSLDVSNFDTDNVTAMQNMFNNCSGLTTLDVSNFNTNNVTNMQSMFYNCNNLTSLDLSNFNTSKVTNMNSMFANCNNLTTLDVSNWDTDKVTNMAAMFWNCKNLTSLDVSNFDTDNVTAMQNMFNNCSGLTTLDVSNFNTSEVTSMQYMFYNCNNLTSLDVSNFNTSKVTNMNSMFKYCKNLTSLDISNWNTSKVTDMAALFMNCNNLTSLDVSNWDTSNVTNMASMFWKCAKLKLLILSNWNFSKVINTNQIFGTNSNVKMSLETLDMANWEISDSTSTSSLFYNNDEESLTSIKNIRCNNVNTINNVILPNIPTRSSDNKGQIITSAELTQEIIDALTSKNWTIVSDNTLTKVAEYVYDSKIWRSMIPKFNDEFVEYFIDDVEDENGLVTRTIRSMGGLPTLMRFGGDSNIKKAKSLLKILDINTSNVTTMKTMFYNCTNLTSLDVSNWDTSNVTNMYGTFSRCYSLTSLDVSNWDTSNVTNMEYIFDCCTNLTQLDISNWDISKIASTLQMFGYCYKLTTLDISNWDISNVTDMGNMFTDAFKLTDIGMLYCTPSTINAIASNLPTTHTQTIWVKDTKPNECTVVSGVEFKEYKENSVMINLSSPLLQGDRIEVVDGKLYHYHKMGSVVLDGSEDENYRFSTYLVGLENLHRIYYLNDSYDSVVNSILIKSNNFRTSNITNTAGQNYECIGQNETYNASIQFNISTSKLSTPDVDGFKQWLQANPTTVVYELVEPYYEDITPIQSKLTLETYLESNLDIYTDLPIKANLTYLTNITNTSSIEEEINTINEGTDLTNLLEDEINN